MSKTIVTHDGKFHADDVFAVATLFLSENVAKVLRTRDEKTIATGDIVVDVGGVYDEQRDRFDHHQVGGAGVRDNQIPYAAFGLVWKKFGWALSGSTAVALRVDEILAVPIDANDNGVDLAKPKFKNVSYYDVSDAVRSFIPTWQEESMDVGTSFIEAVSFAKRIIEREIARAKSVVAGQDKVGEAYAVTLDKRIIVLDRDYSWKDMLARFQEPLYVVHPQNDTWRLYCVRDNPRVFANRRCLPKEWAGLRNEELAEITGVSDALFCHRNRFMAVAETKEGALALAKKALGS